MNNIPELIMLVGIVGSGKSTYAKSLGNNYIIHSSDDLRIELFGDINENSKESNTKVFEELHRRIKSDLTNGKNVIYDATNINRKRRIAFLSELKNIKCHKTCLIVASPYYVCLLHNKLRDRKVPEDVIRRMYMNFQPPHKSEGWDDIDIIFSCDKRSIEDFTIAILYNDACGIQYLSQCNHHHNLTLGDHSIKVANYVDEHTGDDLLRTAALLHDEGKVFTMTAVNSKGQKDGDCHFYQHHCVGSYNSIFYTYNMGFNVEDIIHVATLIYFHMHPYREWKDNTKLENKMKSQLGEELYNEILLLHEADRYAH